MLSGSLPYPTLGYRLKLKMANPAAKKKGLISAVEPLLAQIAASPVFISESPMQTVRGLAGEPEPIH